MSAERSFGSSSTQLSRFGVILPASASGAALLVMSGSTMDQFTMPMPCPAAMIMLPQWKLLKAGFWSGPPSLILP